jgi:hypothetical protein
MKVPAYERRVERQSVTVSTPSELRPPPQAFGTDVAESLTRLGETGKEIAKAMMLHGQRMAQEKQDVVIVQRLNSYKQDMQNRAVNDQTDKNGRPLGYLSRQLGQAEGAAKEFTDFYPQIRKQYLNGLSDYQIAKLQPAMDNYALSLREKIIQHEATQWRENVKNTVESDTKQRIIDASTIRDPKTLGMAIDGAIEVAKLYNSRFDETTRKLKESRIAEDMISSAVDNLFQSTKDFKQADALLFQVKDKVSSQVYNEKRNELFIKAKKAEKEAELAIIEAKNAREDELLSSHILRKDITKQLIESELGMKKINPEFAKSMIEDIESLKRIDAKSNSSTFNKMVDIILAENKPKDVRIELLKENAKGEITDDELRLLYVFNENITKDTEEKALPKKGFLQAISFWSDEYADDRVEVKAKMYKNYIQRITSGEAPEIAVKNTILAFKKMTIYEIGQILSTPRGQVKVIGYDADGEPIIELVK